MRDLIETTMEMLCNCSLSSENLFDIALDCNPATGVLTFRMRAAFASDDGSLVSSELTRSTEQWVVGQRVVDGSGFLVSTSVPTVPPIVDTTTTTANATTLTDPTVSHMPQDNTTETTTATATATAAATAATTAVPEVHKEREGGRGMYRQDLGIIWLGFFAGRSVVSEYNNSHCSSLCGSWSERWFGTWLSLDMVSTWAIRAV